MRVGAVVVHYRHWPGIEKTLDALQQQTHPLMHLIIIDNNSNDGSAEAIRVAYPQLEIVQLTENKGYAAGMNVGLGILLDRGVDATLLLTHECVLGEGALAALTSRLGEARTVGAVGPLLSRLSRPEMVWSAGGQLDKKRWHLIHINEPSMTHLWLAKTPHQVDWLDGACVLLRSEAIRHVGLMDERYFLYFEEADYLIRLAKLGWRLECVPSALAFQEPGQVPPYLEVRNQLLFMTQTGPRFCLMRQIAGTLKFLVHSHLHARTPQARAEAKARSRGFIDFARRRFGPPDARRSYLMQRTS